jgi:hypothetical protein
LGLTNNPSRIYSSDKGESSVHSGRFASLPRPAQRLEKLEIVGPVVTTRLLGEPNALASEDVDGSIVRIGWLGGELVKVAINRDRS